MNPADYDFLVKLLKTETGLALGPDKQYLFEQRLKPIAAQRGLDGLDGLVKELRLSSPRDLVDAVGDAMTTNETLFFRDNKPFNCLRDEVLPSLMETRSITRRLRVWCAAGSTGQEPYSIAMLIAANKPELLKWNLEIVATDISPTAINYAKTGRYTHFEIQRGLPAPMLVRFFSQDGNDWVLKDDIKSMVRYTGQNLLQSFAHLGRFDVIFCRNVLIYFDDDTKRDLLKRFADQLTPDGYLFLGGAETLLGLSDVFRKAPTNGACYQPTNAVTAHA